MKQQQQNIRNKNLFKYSSTKKYLKIFVPDFAFNPNRSLGNADGMPEGVF